MSKNTENIEIKYKKDTNPKVFKYTAKKADFLAISLVCGFLGLLEGGLVELALGLLVPNGWWKPLISGFMALSYLVTLGFLFGPLTGKHTLNRQELKLQFGYVFSATIQRENILRASPAQEKVEMPLPFKAKIEAGVVQAAFSDAGQVWLDLATPQKIRLNFKKATARRILINVNNRAEFLTALDLAPETILGMLAGQDDLKANSVQAAAALRIAKIVE